MSRDQDQDMTLLESKEQLIEYFRSGEKQPGSLGFGTEHEKFVFWRDSGRLASYEEPGGIGDLLGQLADTFGYERAYDNGKLVALTGDGAAITLEPGGQFELSGKITKTVFETQTELNTHLEQLAQVAGDRFAFVSWGMNPFDELDEVPWMPKSRYGIMKRYLPTRGDLAHWMMKMTCTVQGNYDYVSEEDAVDILRTSLRISPIISALFVNSPLRHAQPSGFQSYRCHIWTRTDPDRTGFPDFMYGDDWGYGDYVDYVLDVPMFLIRRDDRNIDMAGHSFRDFMRDGHDGHRATIGDFELHLSTVFPEVRMKKYIEVRGADAGSREMLLALPAIWKGLLYSKVGRAGARSMMVSSNPAQHRECFAKVHREGLRASTPCGDFATLALELLGYARDGLDELAARDGHESEAIFLEPLFEIAHAATTQADHLLADFEALGGDRRALIEKWAF